MMRQRRCSFLAWGLIVAARSRWRWGLAVVAVGCVPVLWGALPDALQTRFETIVNPEVGPANARESAHNRLEGLEIDFGRVRTLRGRTEVHLLTAFFEGATAARKVMPAINRAVAAVTFRYPPSLTARE